MKTSGYLYSVIINIFYQLLQLKVVDISCRSPAKSKLSKPFMFGSGRKDKDKKKEADPAPSGGVSGGNHGAVMVGGPGAVTSAGVVASHQSSHGSGSKDKKKEKEKEKEKKDSKPKLKLKKSKTVENDSDNGKGKSNFFRPQNTITGSPRYPLRLVPD